LCVEELNSPDMLHEFVGHALNYVLERSEAARQQTGHLLHDLVSKGVLPVKVYITGSVLLAFTYWLTDLSYSDNF